MYNSTSSISLETATSSARSAYLEALYTSVLLDTHDSVRGLLEPGLYGALRLMNTCSCSSS
jgi:hypothetical protein